MQKTLLLLLASLLVAISTYGQGFIGDDSSIIAFSNKGCSIDYFPVPGKTIMLCNCKDHRSVHYLDSVTKVCVKTVIMPNSKTYKYTLMQMYMFSGCFTPQGNGEWEACILQQRIQLGRFEGIQDESFVYTDETPKLENN